MSTENPQPPLLTNNEIITRTTIQLILITIYLIIQIIILAKKQTKSFSSLLFISFLIILITFLLSPYRETVEYIFYVSVLVITPILFILNLPLKRFLEHKDSIRLFTKQLVICFLIVSILLIILISLQFRFLEDIPGIDNDGKVIN